MARIEFWGGVGVIGSSKVLIYDGGLDLGLDIPRGSDLFRARRPCRAAGNCRPGSGSAPRRPSPALRPRRARPQRRNAARTAGLQLSRDVLAAGPGRRGGAGRPHPGGAARRGPRRARLVVEYARRYDFAGRPLPARS
ncbi:MAG TPA: hypothetical protein VK586_22220 [Streptosporangiaceae bacterium]|nr:hypothetical protein [Streptosporangiaceae bacterium]